MAKYSTGGGGSDEADSCELCGEESGSLKETTVAGARLQVCGSCARHGESPDRTTSSSGGESRDGDENRRKRAARNVARLDDARKGDSTHWEKEGTDYQDDPLPYLVRGYGEKAEEARLDANLEPGDLAEELGVPEADVLAVEEGRANQAGLGGSLIAAIEERLGIELSE